MNLVIRAHTLKSETLSQAITGHFDERGGTIGRSDTNTLTLPDPERHISRLQAEVWFSNGSFSIRNVGSANAITVNGRPVNPGEGATLAQGDEIVVGGYGMRTTITDSAEPATEAPADVSTIIKATPSEGRTNPRLRVPPTGATAPPAAPSATPASTGSNNPFADLLGSGVAPKGNDPFAGLLSGQPANPPTTSVHVRVPAPPPTPVATRLPDDFDPFADLPGAPSPSAPANAAMASFMSGSPSPSPSQPGSTADMGLGDLLGSPASPPGGSLDAMFGLNAPAAPGSDPLASFLSAPKPGTEPGSQNESKDPLAMFGGVTTPGPASQLPADFNHTPEMKAAYLPPAVKPAAPPPESTVLKPRPAPAAKPAAAPLPPAPRPIAPPPARAIDPTPSGTVPGVKPSRLSFDSAPAPLDALPPAASADSMPPAGTSKDVLWAAFCEGAGVNIKLPQGLTPELMKVLGQVLHRSIDGTIKLVAVRAAAKQELKADVTTIQARNNNPLKFSPDAGTAIEQLLQPPMRGFMMGPVAVTDVMDDLLGHAIGTMAGMRAALTGVLERFEPARLEGKLAGHSVLDSVLPMNRRAKLWELYLQHYKRIRDDAQDDFHDLFGKAFIDAYEEQLDRLDESRHPV
ncbi:MAG: type VI secretion system-associated FHA domain protein TagH [Rhizobacter sp.]